MPGLKHHPTCICSNLCGDLLENSISLCPHTDTMLTLPHLLREDSTVATPLCTILHPAAAWVCDLIRTDVATCPVDCYLQQIAPGVHTRSGTVHLPHHLSRFILPRHWQRCGPAFFASQPSCILQLGLHPRQPLSMSGSLLCTDWLTRNRSPGAVAICRTENRRISKF